LAAPQWAIECLEARTLLTGNVMAAILPGGNLLVLGDSKANQIGIQSTSGSALQISSLDGTTTINGSSGPFTTSGVTGSVFVFLGAGNDVIHVGGGTMTTSIPQNLLIGLGNGTDTAEVANTSVGGNLAIFGGRGGDTVTVGSAATASAVSVDGNLLIYGGFGNTTMAVFDANVDGNLTLIGNGNSDHIQVGYDAGLGIIGDESDTGHVNIGGNLTIADLGSSFGSPLAGLGGALGSIDCSTNPSTCGIGGCLVFAGNGGPNIFGCFNSFFGCFSSYCESGCSVTCTSGSSSSGEHVAVADADVTGNLSIKTGCGNDEILIGAAHTPATDNNPLINLVFGPVSVGGKLNVNSGAGNDTMLLVEVSVTGNTQLDTGAGNDNIGVLDSSSFTGDFTIHAGCGNDSIVLSTNTFSGNVTIYGGRGMDTIGLADSLFEQTVTINGGPGNDTFLQTQVPFANDFAGGAPILNSVETSSDVTATDFAAAFPWISSLLGV
jgi:Ca2+-binding RTX toxin-like protein